MINGPHPYRPPADMSRFYVVTPVSNPIRYQRRYEMYFRFAEMCESAGVKLITVEQSFGLRKFMVTSSKNKYHVQINTVEELWHKENMINIGIRRAIELGAREVAWVDGDCRPGIMPRTWFEETWHALQHYEFCQMWQWLQNLSLNGNPMDAPQPSFMYHYIKHGTPTLEDFIRIQKSGGHLNYPYPGRSSSIFGRPGLAWAANVDALNKVGGLVDFCILGAGDWYMAHALIGTLGALLGEFRSSWEYTKKMMQWQTKCERWIKRDVGYVPCMVLHDFHGRKELRGYGTRGSILVRNKYDPDRDIKYDSQGLLQLETWEPRQIKLRDEIRAYFRARNEDSTTGGED